MEFKRALLLIIIIVVAIVYIADIGGVFTKQGVSEGNTSRVTCCCRGTELPGRETILCHGFSRKLN